MSGSIGHPTQQTNLKKGHQDMSTKTQGFDEMKFFVGQKVVQAAKIIDYAVAPEPADHVIFYLDGYLQVNVSNDVLRRNQPAKGDYLVRYQDGYISWSPADVFETAYCKIAAPFSTKPGKVSKADHSRAGVVWETKVALFTAFGRKVAEISVPPYARMPRVLLWGDRYFIRKDGEEVSFVDNPEQVPVYFEETCHFVMPGQTHSPAADKAS